jgi:hypothetical protein
MSGVDGKPIDVYMQNVSCQLPGLPASMTFPFCIGDIDCLLFGRYGVWNQFSSILEDQVKQQTVFTL